MLILINFLSSLATPARKGGKPVIGGRSILGIIFPNLVR